MNTIKKVAGSTKKFIYDHRVGVAVVLTALVVGQPAGKAIRERDDFLKEHDLYEEFLNN